MPPRTPPRTPWRAHPYAVPHSRPAHTDAAAHLTVELLHFLHTDADPRRQCREMMTAYQTACLKDDAERANLLYVSAKQLATAVFGSVQDGIEYMRSIELAHPGRDPVTAMPLSQFEQLQSKVQSKMQTMPPERKRQLVKLAETHASAWDECYTGRRLYRMQCEAERDKGHAVAYWIFKMAIVICTVLHKL